MEYKKTFSSFSVDDVDKAKDFYGNVMKLKVKQDPKMDGLLNVKLADGEELIIYPKPDHKPASFTVLNFMVNDIEKTVDTLAENGVRFEHYTGEFNTNEKGIAQGRGPKIAWFKDPAGNILSVIEEY
jgi:predicted enzyme related to lactoylglutathione lyase